MGETKAIDQWTMFGLVIVMAVCCAAIAGLMVGYFYASTNALRSVKH